MPNMIDYKLAVTGNITRIEVHYMEYCKDLHDFIPNLYTESNGILSMFNFTNKLKSYIRNVQLYLRNVKYVALHLELVRYYKC